jgi:hypothetical protein
MGGSKLKSRIVVGADGVAEDGFGWFFAEDVAEVDDGCVGGWRRNRDLGSWYVIEGLKGGCRQDCSPHRMVCPYLN